MPRTSQALAGVSPSISRISAVKGPKSVIKIIVISLILDILAFTCILPLFPRTIEAYRTQENFESGTLLAKILSLMQKLRHSQAAFVGWFHDSPLNSNAYQISTSESADIVLLGGILGSVYSILQCIAAPVFGRLSDRFGRRNVLLISMLGNIVWTVMWLFSDSFEKFLVARIVAGLCEANLQISTAVISDVTKPETRAKQMALVGISFSIGFTVGPTIGAYFASMGANLLSADLIFRYSGSTLKLAPFANAAIFSLVLLLIETAYLYKELPETVGYFTKFEESEPVSPVLLLDEKMSPIVPEKKSNFATASTLIPRKVTSHINVPKQDSAEEKSAIRKVSLVYFAYMFIFSGMEYSLTFLMHDLFKYTNKQQGTFLGAIGMASAVFQGYYLRKYVSKFGEKAMVLQGFVGCVFGMVSVAMLAYTKSSTWLYGVVLGFSIASAIVTSTMNAIITLISSTGTITQNATSENDKLNSLGSLKQTQVQQQQPNSKKSISAKALIETKTNSASRLGDFRSYGQLGRAFGPGAVCFIYWLFGPFACYSVGAVGVALVSFAFSKIKLD